MPTAEQHRKQAAHNKSFVLSFDFATTPYRDWAVTGAFYSALHWVEWFLTSHGHTARRDHRLRDAYIARFADLRSIYADYSELKFHSEAARYDCAEFSEDVAKKDILPRLIKIETHVRSLINKENA